MTKQNKKTTLLIFVLLITLVGYSQDYKVEKTKKITNGNFEINRLLVITDSVAEYDINEFIEEFTTTLKTDFEKNNFKFLCIRKGKFPIKNSHYIFEDLNPNGVMEFRPSQFFVRYRGFSQKTGLYFNLTLSYRTKDVNEFTQLFTIRIGVMTDSFENAGIPAAHTVFNRMIEAGYLSTKEKVE